MRIKRYVSCLLASCMILGLAGCGDKLVREHRHRDARGTAVVLFQRVPALDGYCLHVVGFNPVLDGHAELSLDGELLFISVGNLCIVAGAVAHLDELGVVVLDFLGGIEYL